MSQHYNNVFQLLCIFVTIGLLITNQVKCDEDNYKPITAELTLNCSNIEGNLGIRFHKNGQMISDQVPFNNDTYNQYPQTVGSRAHLILVIKKLVLDDDESVYKAFDPDPDNTSGKSCTFNVSLCANKDTFDSILEVEIDNTNTTDIIIDDPFNFKINYFYKVEALPLKPSTIEFYISNKSHRKEAVDQDCTTTDSLLKCYNIKSSFSVTNTYPGETIEARVFNNQIDIEKFNGVCDLDLNFYNQTRLFNILYNSANFSVNNTNDWLTLNDTVHFYYNVVWANPKLFSYSLNTTLCETDTCTNEYKILSNNTSDESFSYEYTITSAFYNITFEYCVDNGIKQICGTSFYEYVKPTGLPFTTTTTTPTETFGISTIIVPDNTPTKTPQPTITSEKPPQNDTITEPPTSSGTSLVWWEWLIVGMVSAVILCVVVVSLIIFYRKRKQKRDYGKNIYDKPQHKESHYNSASKKETNV